MLGLVAASAGAATSPGSLGAVDLEMALQTLHEMVRCPKLTLELEILRKQEKAMRALMQASMDDEQQGKSSLLAHLLRAEGAGLRDLTLLCASPLDNVRWMAIAVLLRLMKRAHGDKGDGLESHVRLDDDHQVRLLSDRIYTQLYDMERLAQAIATVATPDTSGRCDGEDETDTILCLGLDDRELGALCTLCRDVSRAQRDMLDAMTLPASIVQRIEGCLAERPRWREGFFVKLSTRSPTLTAG